MQKATDKPVSACLIWSFTTFAKFQLYKINVQQNVAGFCVVLTATTSITSCLWVRLPCSCCKKCTA